MRILAYGPLAVIFISFNAGHVEAQINMAEVRDGSTVSIEFTLRLDDGSVADTNVGRAPVVYLQGQQQLPPALEANLLGMKLYEIRKITLPPEDGYGPVHPEDIQTIPLENVPEDARYVGAELAGEGPNGQQLTARVVDINERSATVDLNHPLAGENLHFEIKILKIVAPEVAILKDLERRFGKETVALAARGAEEWMNRGAGEAFCEPLGVMSGRQLLALPYLPSSPRFNNIAYEWDEVVKDVWSNYNTCMIGASSAGIFFELAIDIQAAQAAGLISQEAIQERERGCSHLSGLTEREKSLMTGERLRELYIPCVEAVLEFVTPFTPFVK